MIDTAYGSRRRVRNCALGRDDVEVVHSRDPLARNDGADCPTGKSPNCCPAPFAKIFLFRLTPNQIYIDHVPSPRGALAIVIDAGRDAVDAAASGAQGDRRAR